MSGGERDSTAIFMSVCTLDQFASIQVLLKIVRAMVSILCLLKMTTNIKKCCIVRSVLSCLLQPRTVQWPQFTENLYVYELNIICDRHDRDWVRFFLRIPEQMT